MPHTSTKYRPAFTLAQLTYIASHTPKDTPEGREIIKIVIPLIAKVEMGAINPAYKLSETHALKLSEKAERERYENDLMSPEEQAEYESRVLGM